MFRTVLLWLVWLSPLSQALAQSDDAENKAAVLCLSPDGVEPLLCAKIERDLRNMFDQTAQLEPERPAVLEIENRFDVGHISKGTLSKASRHFNNAQRAFEKGDFAEAKDQLFRAKRFYIRAIPYSADPGLLREIFFYQFRVEQAAGDAKKAEEAYCEYVALARALAGNPGPLEQFKPLAERCGGAQAAGTAELRVKTNVDGAHVYIDGRRVGVIGRRAPFVNPFVPAGPHFIEVRKVGHVRWGTLVNLKNESSKSLNARLKTARGSVLNSDLQPLLEVTVVGEDRNSDDYLSDLLFRMSEQYRVRYLVVAYLTRVTKDLRLVILSYDGDRVVRFERPLSNGAEAYQSTLKKFWEETYGRALDPTDAQPDFRPGSPTVFKVD